MGIKDLLPQLTQMTREIHISELCGKRVGVDAYVWLHQKAFCCAKELVQGQPTTLYIHAFMQECELLLHFGVIPVIVFDGGPLGSKAAVEQSRLEKRERNKSEAERLYACGDRAKAYKKFERCVDVTPQMAYEIILRLRERNIQYVVAPYEADAQLAFLSLRGHVDAVISVDSDLLTFGVRCLITKYGDKGRKGVGQLVDMSLLRCCKHPLNLSSFSLAKFVVLCILMGCDYLPRIKGMGPKKMHRLLLEVGTWPKVVSVIRSNGKHKVPHNYETNFSQALWTFRHQRVYDREQKRLVHLRPLPPGELEVGELKYLGEHMHADRARLVAEGVISPVTFKRFVSKVRWNNYKNKKRLRLPLSETGRAEQTLNRAKLKRKRRRHAHLLQTTSQRDMEFACELQRKEQRRRVRQERVEKSDVEFAWILHREEQRQFAHDTTRKSAPGRTTPPYARSPSRKRLKLQISPPKKVTSNVLDFDAIKNKKVLTMQNKAERNNTIRGLLIFGRNVQICHAMGFRGHGSIGKKLSVPKSSVKTLLCQLCYLENTDRAKVESSTLDLSKREFFNSLSVCATNLIKMYAQGLSTYTPDLDKMYKKQKLLPQ